MTADKFEDRRDAGRRLARDLAVYAGEDPVILALPRGGVPVGHEVARALGCPLDVCVVRKLGLPGQEEFAIGAIGPGGVRVLNPYAQRMLDVPAHVVEAVAEREARELERRERAYRQGRPPLSVAGRTVILVDDGLATGSTMRAAIAAVRQLGAARVVAAAPVGAPESCEELRSEADQVVCSLTPRPFGAVGVWYRDFSQTSDEEVQQLLAYAVAGTEESSWSR